MKKFRSIEGLVKVFKHMRANADYNNIPHSELPTLNFTGTVKIHGTNAGIVINGPLAEKATAQGKDRELHIMHDNAGFAAYCYSLPKEVVQEIYAAFNPSGKGILTVFGEWAGEGVQNGVAVSSLPKHFIAFAAHIEDGDKREYIELNRSYTNHEWKIYNIYEVPTYSIDINFAEPGNIEDELTRITLEVESNCPWGKKFGVDGIGEGVVWHLTSDPTDSSFIFKTKGPKHSVRKDKNGKSASIDVEKVNNISECVDIILTENRMIQMINDHKIEFSTENVGTFLKALHQDCIKEEMDVIVQNGLTWKDVVGTISRRAREWFLSHIKI